MNGRNRHGPAEGWGSDPGSLSGGSPITMGVMSRLGRSGQTRCAVGGFDSPPLPAAPAHDGSAQPPSGYDHGGYLTTAAPHEVVAVVATKLWPTRCCNTLRIAVFSMTRSK